MLDKLRDKCLELMEKDKNKYELIASILSDDDCFKKLSVDMAFSILSDLEVEDKDKVYIELMKR